MQTTGFTLFEHSTIFYTYASSIINSNLKRHVKLDQMYYSSSSDLYCRASIKMSSEESSMKRRAIGKSRCSFQGIQGGGLSLKGQYVNELLKMDFD